MLYEENLECSPRSPRAKTPNDSASPDNPIDVAKEAYTLTAQDIKRIETAFQQELRFVEQVERLGESEPDKTESSSEIGHSDDTDTTSSQWAIKSGPAKVQFGGEGEFQNCWLQVDGAAEMIVRRPESEDDLATPTDPILEYVALDGILASPLQSETAGQPFALKLQLDIDSDGATEHLVRGWVEHVVAFKDAEHLAEWQRCFETNAALRIWLSYPEIQLVMFELNGVEMSGQEFKDVMGVVDPLKRGRLNVSQFKEGLQNLASVQIDVPMVDDDFDGGEDGDIEDTSGDPKAALVALVGTPGS